MGRWERAPAHKEKALSTGGPTVNKNDLISSVADSSGLSKTEATKAVDSVLSAITGVLRGGGDVRLVGFGTFSVSRRAQTQGRNPRTGARRYVGIDEQSRNAVARPSCKTKVGEDDGGWREEVEIYA